jgi:hypothetical protein
MQQLETIKGQTIIVPQIVKRYLIAFYDYSGWKIYSDFNSTPENAIQRFISWQEKIKDEDYRAKYYKVIEVELEIPFVPKEN